jgi:hypothetical protein
MSAPPRHAPSPSTAAIDQGPLSPGGVKVLKIAVVVMAIMIVLGVALVIGRIIYLASTTKPDNAETAIIQELKPRQTVSLPAGSRLDQASVDGDRLLLRYDRDGITELSIYDLRRSRIITTIVIGTAPDRNKTPTNPAASRK